MASLELSGGGAAWLIDAYGWRPGLPDPRPVALPRVDVGAMTVDEGDSGTMSYEVPVSVTGGDNGTGAGTVRLFIGGADGRFTPRLVTVQPGHQTIEIPFDVTGNTRWSWGAAYYVMARALHGTVSGGYVGGLTVNDDDPEPTVTITGTPDTVAEGGALTWTATSSAVADSPLYRFGTAITPESGAELSTTDVDPQWFLANAFGEEVLPSRPLSSTSVFLFLVIEPGELTATATVPTVVDTESEPTEYVRFAMESYPEGHTEELDRPVGLNGCRGAGATPRRIP